MKPVITDIPGIGPAAADALAEYGIKTLAGMARASVEKITSVPGFSEARAVRVRAAATELLAASAPPTPARESEKKDKPASKDKKDKKKKGKRKDKDKKKDKKKGKGKKKGKK